MNIIKNAVCPGCTLLCDDVTFLVNGQRIESDNQCDMAQQWIGWANSKINAPHQSADEVRAAIRHLVSALKQSKMPVISGLANLPLQSQQVAWKIADATGAALGNTIEHRSQGSLYALQRQGKVTASLGEVANRGDLLIFWFCDPAQTHPRLLEKLKAGENKTVVVIDSTKTRSSQLADQFIQVKQDNAIEFLSNARRLLTNKDSDTASIAAGEGGNQAVQLVDLVTKCAYGCLIYGDRPTTTADDPETLGHQKWVRQLSDHTRMVSIGLRTDGNGRSGENVMSAFSGYPVAVSQAKGIPEYCGDIWSTSRLLERGQCDFLLLFAGRSLETELASLGTCAREHLATLPKVVIFSGPRPESPLLKNARMLQVAIPGASSSGDFCRLDDVLLPLAALRESKLPTDEAILCRVFESFGVATLARAGSR